MLQWVDTWIKPATLQFDLAAALIALAALWFSVEANRRQTRLAARTSRIERDNDIIEWVNRTIATIVQIEFFLRDCARSATGKLAEGKRDDFLAQLSMAIDQGRLYFPNFHLDQIAPAPATEGRSADDPRSSRRNIRFA